MDEISNQIWRKTGMGTICHHYNYSWRFQFELNGKVYQIGRDGHLANIEDWDLDVAEYLAKEEGVRMTDAHWEVIHFIREYYEEYKIAPMIKILVKAIAKKLGPEKGNTKYLCELFPVGPAAQANKIAGLPMPHGQF